MEETKVNFYDPQGDHLAEAATGLYNTAENHEENAILEAAVDPLEWKQELDRVYKDLVNIEKDIEVLKKEGGDSFTPEFEEYKRHLDLILNMSKEI